MKYKHISVYPQTYLMLKEIRKNYKAAMALLVHAALKVAAGHREELEQSIVETIKEMARAKNLREEEKS